METRGGDDYDLVIIDARMAGSTLAVLVGEAGYRVLLVDRAAFPSPMLKSQVFGPSKRHLCD